MKITKNQLTKIVNKGENTINHALKEIIKQFNIEDEGKILEEKDIDKLSKEKKVELLEVYMKEIKKRFK